MCYGKVSRDTKEKITSKKDKGWYWVKMDSYKSKSTNKWMRRFSPLFLWLISVATGAAGVPRRRAVPARILLWRHVDSASLQRRHDSRLCSRHRLVRHTGRRRESLACIARTSNKQSIDDAHKNVAFKIRFFKLATRLPLKNSHPPVSVWKLIHF